MSPDRVRVSVITPFHNTARYLDECIGSVTAQTFRDFEYILVNNQSTDGSAEIARRWAAQDSRIRVYDQPRLLSQPDNYSDAMTRIGPRSEYVKVVQADDWIYPECLERLVAVADTDPTVVIASSYYLSDPWVFFSGLIPLDRAIHEGADICRLQLRRRFFMGNPTTVMYRARAVRERHPFFQSGHLYDDGEAFIELLRRGRFAFVPRILSGVRTDNAAESIMGASGSFDWFASLEYLMIRRYAREFLPAAEARFAETAAKQRYGRRLLTAALRARGPDYFAFHRARLGEVGESLSLGLVFRWGADILAGALAHYPPALLRRLTS